MKNITMLTYNELLNGLIRQLTAAPLISLASTRNQYDQQTSGRTVNSELMYFANQLLHMVNDADASQSPDVSLRTIVDIGDKVCAFWDDAIAAYRQTNNQVYTRAYRMLVQVTRSLAAMLQAEVTALHDLCSAKDWENVITPPTPV